MRVSPLIAVFSIAIAAPLAGADVQFRDGRVWSGVRVLHQEPTYLLVMHDRGIYTVHAEDVTEEAAATIGIRMPTPEEIAARQKADAEARKLAAQRNSAAKKTADDREAGAGRATTEFDNPRTGSPQPPDAEPPVVQEFSSIIAPQQSLPIVRLSGRVLARLAQGAIVRADGMPANHDYGDIGWVVGTIFVQEDGRLNASYRGAPLNGRVAPAGEHRYTDSQGSVHVLSAWRLE
ncbi:MAG TPA: hypothetical protein VGA56_01625 [Opitutaceae bacterium]